MRGVSPANSVRSSRNAMPYTVSPISSVRAQNILNAGQAYNFQNAESGSTVQYGTQTRDSGVVQVDQVSYRYDMDSRERLKVRNMLGRQKASGKSNVEIGKYIVETYYNRDQGLGGLVTKLVTNGRTYVTITAVVMKAVGSNPPVQQGWGPGSAYAAPKPNPLPPLRNGEPGGHIFSKYETSGQFNAPSRGSANQKYIFEDDEDPPILRPTTLKRIRRGYFDPTLDNPKYRK
ncbi:hypothetical protein MaudCBS49596_003669 [Microsporum audouinii]